jgi:hypothetical protein
MNASGDVASETSRKVEQIVTRLSAAAERARKLREDRERAAADAAAGKTESGKARREKLAAADQALAGKLDDLTAVQEAAEKRRQRRETEAARELAEARLRAEIRAVEIAERVQMKTRQNQYRLGQTAAKIEDQNAKRQEQLAVTAELAAERRKQRSDDLREAQTRPTLRMPGPSDVDNRFFSIGKRSLATTGAKPKRNMPAFSIGIRKEVLAASPSFTPGSNKYLPRYDLLDSSAKYSFGHRYAVPASKDPAETPGPMDVRACASPRRILPRGLSRAEIVANRT